MRIYLLSCETVENGGGIYAYDFTENGALKKYAYFPCDRPMYAVIHNNILHVLLREPFENGNSGYFSCDLQLVRETEVKDTLGKVACHLAITDHSNYIVNYLSGNVVKDCAKEIKHFGQGVNFTRQDCAHTHYVYSSLDNSYVLVTDLGLDRICVYDSDLQLVSHLDTPKGYGVRHLVVTQDEKIIYAVHELKPSVCKISCNKGVLSNLNFVELPCSNEAATGAAIRLSKDEKYLYVSVRGENALYVLDADTLVLLQKCDSGGIEPRDFNLIGNYLVCANLKSNNISIFTIQDGLIINKLNDFDIVSPICVV